MDLRHYDTTAHGLDSAYEDVQPGFSTPHGVARTSELTLYPCGAVPDARRDGAPGALAQSSRRCWSARPQYLHAAQAFGVWGLPDRSTPAKKAIEDQLDAAFAFYQQARSNSGTGTASGISAT